uniref:Doublecortin domain-containing protein n=1 Tax=Steinernema glaseri TaxID=37863 RepID=A0A1I7Y9D8_9BILA
MEIDSHHLGSLDSMYKCTTQCLLSNDTIIHVRGRTLAMPVTAERVSEDDRPRTTKNVFIYKAGDHSWPGIRVPLNKRRHRSIDAVLDELTQKIPGLPYGVRLLATPRGRHEITSIDQLQHLGSYLATEKTSLRAMPKTDYDRILENQRYNAGFRGSMRCWHTSKTKSDSSQSLPIPRPARLPKLKLSTKRNKSSDVAQQKTSAVKKNSNESSPLPPLNRQKLLSNQQRTAEAPKILSRKEMLHVSDEEPKPEEEGEDLDRQNQAATKIQRFYRSRLSKSDEQHEEVRPKRPGTGDSSETFWSSGGAARKEDHDETDSLYSNHSLQNASDTEEEFSILEKKQ